MDKSKSLLLRSAALSGFAELALEFGLNPGALLRLARIDRKAINDPDKYISSSAFDTLLELSSKLSSCPDFGLRLSLGRDIRILGPVGLLALNEPNVKEALSVLSRHLPLHNEGLRTKYDVENGLVRMIFSKESDFPSSVSQAIELTIGVAVNFFRSLLGSAWNPLEVCFLHAAPLDSSLHRRIFRSPVYFNHGFNGIIFPEADLEKATHGADEQIRKYMAQYIDSIEEVIGNDLVAKTLKVINEFISSGRCSKTLIAQCMAMEPQTLQRKLKFQGRSFKQLMEQARGTLAAQYLSDSQKTISEIAELLGYSELSAFSRFFQRTYGATPSGWRQEILSSNDRT